MHCKSLWMKAVENHLNDNVPERSERAARHPFTISGVIDGTAEGVCHGKQIGQHEGGVWRLQALDQLLC